MEKPNTPSKIPRKTILVAYHEAGHAVAAYLLKVHRIRSISIIPDAETEGRVHHSKPGKTYHPEWDTGPRTRSKTEKMIMLCLAGDMAENMLLKRDSRNTRLTDYDTAVDLACYHCSDGDEAGAYVNFLYYRTRNLLRLPERWAAIEELASVLIERGCMGPKLAYQIMRSYLPRRRVGRAAE
jgi:hypothetical protein